MTMSNTSTLAVEIHEDRICLGVIKIQGRRATVIRTISDILVQGEDPCAKVLSIVKSLGIKKASLYVVASPKGVEHRMLTLPPMNPIALQRFISTKISADLNIPHGELSWAFAKPSGTKTRGICQTMAVVVKGKQIDPWRSLEDLGFPVEVLTTPEMAIYSIGRDLSGTGDAIYIYPSEETTILVASSLSGPIFIRTVNAGHRSAGLLQLLQEELRYTNIYLQQHLKKTVNRICIIANEDVFENILPAVGATSGVETVRLGGESLVSGDSTGVFLAAAIMAAKDRKGAPNLLRGEAAIRRGIKVAALTLMLAAGLLITLNLKIYLDHSIQKSKLTRETQDLEQSLLPLRTMAAPDWRNTEKDVLRTLQDMEELQSPPWPRVLKEISLATPPGVRFNSMNLSRGGKKDQPSKRGKKQNRTTKEDSAREWIMTIQGGVSGDSYHLVQMTFRRWYETLLTSPYLKKVDIGSVNLMVRQESGILHGDIEGSNQSGEMRFKLTAVVQTEKEVEHVIKSLDTRPSS